jgi:hypothetical protein
MIMTREENISGFDKLEFWALTALFVFCLPLHVFGDYNVIRYVVIFLAVLYVDFRAVPAIARGERLTRNIMTLAGIFAVIFVVFALTSQLIFSDPFRSGGDPDTFLKISSQCVVVALLIAGHLVVKRLALFIISKIDMLRSFFVIPNRDGLVVFGLWMIVSYWILIIPVPTEVRAAWLTIIPTGILLHAIAFYYFIPASFKWKYPLVAYFIMVGSFCLVIGMGVAIFMMMITADEDRASEIGAFDGVIHFIFTSPALWLIYRWQQQGKEQIHALKSELGRSVANVDFLRSQINPHFLFNALNTIYGLAIQEKAERTSASVEKLGDMMRFMLLENMQERISLRRELEYLDNYINLQRLRTDANPQLTIRVDIPGEIDPVVRIAPMLLVPFVENAFKHGISLREQSYITIFLELKNSTLYFDISNSMHQRMENDPERDSNGIGLENVRQRLQHMYTGRHELLVRSTGRDFFVHLRVELD